MTDAIVGVVVLMATEIEMEGGRRGLKHNKASHTHVSADDTTDLVADRR